ncbi:hypothetical protein FS749_002240 [Ceratobasidium sp. UAMH 11750]|nr:hypothetical protein FS749_002240 [Ceratobasidium sp. UAMH 11750]
MTPKHPSAPVNTPVETSSADATVFSPELLSDCLIEVLDEQCDPPVKTDEDWEGLSKSDKMRKSRAQRRLAQTTSEKLDYLSRIGIDYTDQSLSSLTTREIADIGRENDLLPAKQDDPDRHKHRRVLCIDLDQHAQEWRAANNITGDDPVFLNKDGVTETDLVEKGFKFLDHGFACGFKREEDIPKLVFAVSFCPLDTPDDDDPLLSDIEKEMTHSFVKFLHVMRDTSPKCTTNKAHRDAGEVGIMQSAGHRPGSDKGFRAGEFATKKNSPLSHAERKPYEVDGYAFLDHFFKKTSPDLHDKAWGFMNHNELPGVGAHSLLEEALAPGSSFYFSHSGYSNRVHRDRDVSDYAYGAWLTTRRPQRKRKRNDQADHGTIVTDPADIKCRGGQFFFPQYGIAIDFNKCGGPAFVTWGAPTEWHATAITEVEEGYDRWGCSLQVTKPFWSIMRRIRAEGGDYRDTAAYESGRFGSGEGIVRKEKGKGKSTQN